MFLGITLGGLFVRVALAAVPTVQAVQTVSADGVVGLIFWTSTGFRVIARGDGVVVDGVGYE